MSGDNRCPNSIYQTEGENWKLPRGGKWKETSGLSLMLNRPVSSVCLPSSSPARTEKKVEVSWEAVKAGKTSRKGGEGGLWWRLVSGMAFSSRDLSTCPSPTFRNIPAAQQTKHGERARNWPLLWLSTADLSDRTCKGTQSHMCIAREDTGETHARPGACAATHGDS